MYARLCAIYYIRIYKSQYFVNAKRKFYSCNYDKVLLKFKQNFTTSLNFIR